MLWTCLHVVTESIAFFGIGGDTVLSPRHQHRFDWSSILHRLSRSTQILIMTFDKKAYFDSKLRIQQDLRHPLRGVYLSTKS